MPRSAPRPSHPTIAANPTSTVAPRRSPSIWPRARHQPERHRQPDERPERHRQRAPRRTRRATPPMAVTTAVVSTAAATSIGPTRAQEPGAESGRGAASPTGPGDDDGERPRGGPGRDAGGDRATAVPPIVTTLSERRRPGPRARERARPRPPAPTPGSLRARLGPHADRAPASASAVSARPSRWSPPLDDRERADREDRGQRRGRASQERDGDRRDGADQRADEPVRGGAGVVVVAGRTTGSRVSIDNAARIVPTPAVAVRGRAMPGRSPDAHPTATGRRTSAGSTPNTSRIDRSLERRAGAAVGHDPAAVHDDRPAGRNGPPGRGRAGRPRPSCRRAR